MAPVVVLDSELVAPALVLLLWLIFVPLFHQRGLCCHLCRVRCRPSLAYAAQLRARPRRRTLGLRRHLHARMCCLLREILRDFGFTPTGPTRIYEDNLACVAMSGNPVRRKYSRHVDIRRYFICDLVAQLVIKLVPLRTNLMVADALSKSLPAPAHAKHRDVMIGRVPFCVRTLRSSNCVVGGYILAG